MTANPSELSVLRMDLQSEAEDWQPTPHGRLLARVLAEQDLVLGKRVLELGSGLGNHTIVMARRGARSIVATEIQKGFAESTRRNVERNVGADAPVEYRVANWLDTPGRFDVVVTNPPFCKSGKQNRRYFIDSLILDVHHRLEGAGSQVIFVQSSMADLAKSLRRLDENGFDGEVLAREQHPFRDYYLEDESFLAEIAEVPDGFEVRDGEHYENLYVVRGTLRTYTPPQGAHVFS